MNTAYLLLGSNIGKREAYLYNAIALINKKAGKVIGQSSLYTTKAWGNENQNDFLNQALCVETNFSAEELLQTILKIEKQLGRTRTQKWEARTIDIDILFFNPQIINSSTLTIPHPHLCERRFALVPLAEIALELIHPVLKKSVSELLKDCNDKLEVIKIPFPTLSKEKEEVQKKSSPLRGDREGLPFFISIEGNIGAGKTTLAKILAKELNASLLLEKFEENPFLKKFYKNPKQHALSAEFWFLTERCRQMKKLFSAFSLERRKEGEVVVSDYDISKCLIFAKVNLTKPDFILYEEFFKNISRNIPSSDLLIYLHQTPRKLKKSILKRGRVYEKQISLAYLNKVQNGYKTYLKGKKSNHLMIDCDKFDFRDKDDTKRMILSLKRTMGC